MSHRARQTLSGHGRQGFAERQTPHGRHVRDDRINDRLLGVSIWVGVAQLPGRRVVRTANGPLHMGPFLLRGVQDTGREISREAGNWLNLGDAVALSHSCFLSCRPRLSNA